MRLPLPLGGLVSPHDWFILGSVTLLFAFIGGLTWFIVWLLTKEE
jgi:hypothetical protein